MDLPPGDSSQVLVSEAATQTLSNKSVNGDNNTLSNIAITSLKIGGSQYDVLLRDGSGAVVNGRITNDSVAAAAAIALGKLASVTNNNAAIVSDGSGKLTSLASVTATEVGHLQGVTSNIQSQLNLKEPTITILPISKGGTNSSTSLNNNRLMISSGSAIVEASALTASRALASDASGLPVASATTSTELGYLSGVTSAVQTQINAKADTSALTAHTGASSGVHGVTGSVVGTTDTQVLTNKDHDGGTASNASRFTLPKANKSVLDGLTRKQATLVYGSDTNKVYADDGSTLKEIGSGSSGINYLSGQYGADSLGTVETSVGDVLASSTRSNPTQWGNSAASALITQSTDSTLRGTTNYLVAYTANAQFVESPLFSIDGEDLGKPLLVQFDVSGVGTANDVQVYIARYNSSNVLQERILVAGTASATTPNSAQVPTGVTTFKGFFIPSATSTDKYAVRWLRNANNTSMRLDTFFVGPQSLAQGAIVTRDKFFTPSIGISGTFSSQRGEYQRAGNRMNARVQLTFATVSAINSPYTLTIPDSLNYDGSNIPVSDEPIVGTFSLWDASASYIEYVGTVHVNSATTLKFKAHGQTSFNNSSVPVTIAANDILEIQFSLPISEWSSGTTTLADRAVEEYVSHNGTVQSTGPDGALIPTTTPAGTSEEYIITTQSSILSTDTFVLEMQRGGVGGWFRSNDRIDSLRFDGTNFIGAGVYFDGTNLKLIRGKYKSGTASTWSGLSGDKWRVRKVSGGAAIGFPVSARNIVGDTSGTAVPQGYVGQQITWATPPSNQVLTTIESDWTNATINLTAGVWNIFCNISMVYNCGSTASSIGNSQFKLTDSSNNVVQNCWKQISCSQANVSITTSASASCVVSISSNTTYKIRVQRYDAIGTGTGTVYNTPSASSEFYAIRIA